MRVAYADPPYLGSAQKRYPEHPESWVYDSLGGHQQLIERLVDEFPDGWALSMAATNLRDLLPLCPAEVRIMAWVKPWTRFFLHVNPAFAWEPLVVMGGRPRGTAKVTIRDWVAAGNPMVKGATGLKPLGFCYWLFDVLGMEPDDELVDLFPGSGAVGRAWDLWRDSLFLRVSAARSAVSMEGAIMTDGALALGLSSE